MGATLTVFLTNLYFPFLTATDASSMDGLLQEATKLVTWIITQMGSFLTFITTNPIVLVMFLLLLAGAGIGFLMRIWHSV